MTRTMRTARKSTGGRAPRKEDFKASKPSKSPSKPPVNEFRRNTYRLSRDYATISARLARSLVHNSPEVGQRRNAHRICRNGPQPAEFWYFMLLPPEIREMVYSQVLGNPTRLEASTRPSFGQTAMSPALLLVDKQISQEVSRYLARSTICVIRGVPDHRPARLSDTDENGLLNNTNIYLDTFQNNIHCFCARRRQILLKNSIRRIVTTSSLPQWHGRTRTVTIVLTPFFQRYSCPIHSGGSIKSLVRRVRTMASNPAITWKIELEPTVAAIMNTWRGVARFDQLMEEVKPFLIPENELEV